MICAPADGRARLMAVGLRGASPAGETPYVRRQPTIMTNAPFVSFIRHWHALHRRRERAALLVLLACPTRLGPPGTSTPPADAAAPSVTLVLHFEAARRVIDLRSDAP